MKTLLLIRHAKSSWADPSLADHDRPLNARGLRAAPLMGRRLAKRGLRPDLLLSSSARRARDTAHLMADALGCAPELIRIEPRLYEASIEDTGAVVSALDGQLQCVALFGHNPTWEQVAQRLCPQIERMPTAAVAAFEFDAAGWRGLLQRTPLRVHFDYPKRVDD
jgi:phosphohistidine phosphatase